MGRDASKAAHDLTSKAYKENTASAHKAAAAAHSALAFRRDILSQMARGNHIALGEKHTKLAKQLEKTEASKVKQFQDKKQPTLRDLLPAKKEAPLTPEKKTTLKDLFEKAGQQSKSNTSQRFQNKKVLTLKDIAPKKKESAMTPEKKTTLRDLFERAGQEARKARGG